MAPFHAAGKALELNLKNMSNMAPSVNVLLSGFLLLLLAHGAKSEKCTPASVEVLQTSNGEKSGLNPLFEGFASSVPVDPKLLRKEGSDYLVGDGGPIPSGGEVQFRYASDREFEMGPAAVQEDCSGLHESTV